MRSRWPAAAVLPAVLLPGVLSAQAPASAPLASPARAAVHVDTVPAPCDAPPASPLRPTATAPTPPSVSFFGEVRTRSEIDHPVGAPRADAFTYLRTRLGVRAIVGEGVRVAVEAQDSRVLGTEELPGAPNALDLHEGYVEIARPWRRAQVTLRAGRQEIAIGNERLVGRVNWSNTGRSFDAIRLSAGPASSTRPPWSATAFAATLAERGARSGGAAAGGPAERDHYVLGVAATRPFAALPGGSAELTVVHDRGVHARGHEIAARTTAAGRLRAARVLGVSADLEGAVQTGRQHALSTATASGDGTIRAWMLAARLGTPTAERAAGTAPPPRLSAAVGLELLSGDAAAGDGRDGAFSTLYATNHPYYGLADVIGGDPAASLRGHGLADGYATATYGVTRALSVRADLHRLAPARTTGLPGGPLGWEADLVAPLRVAPGATVELGYGAFRAGNAGTALGLGAAGHVRGWGYLQLTAGF